MQTCVESRSGATTGLVERVEAIRARAVARDHPAGRLELEGVAMHEVTTLVFHGKVNAGTVPHLEGLLDSVLSLQPLSLVVDLSQAQSVSGEVFAAIERRQAEVSTLTVRPPRPIDRGCFGGDVSN